MTELSWDKPQLFLYSQDDPLCGAKYLDALIEKKKEMYVGFAVGFTLKIWHWRCKLTRMRYLLRRGQRVEAVKWDKSTHCGHFKVHYVEYTTALLRFLYEITRGSKVELISKL